MAAIQHTRAFGANMSSLNGLEITIEGDEADLNSKLISLDLAKFEDGTKVTKAVFEETDGIKFGHLIFEEYDGTPVDEQSRIAIHKAKKESHVCTGRAFISNQAKNVIVFREQ